MSKPVKKDGDLVACVFCATKNKLPTVNIGTRTLICGKCKKPLFILTEGRNSGLSGMVGLESVKKELTSILHSVKVNQERYKKGLPKVPQTLHFVFRGSPGTGKTEVARILASELKKTGYLSNGQLVETERSQLVGQYHGHTAPKTIEVCKSALGGILFIDEAYSLVLDERDWFGREAIDTLLKFMEDNRNNLVVIVAGYQSNMDNFIQSNPGLKSRFTRFIDFPDYSISELCDIFKSILNKNGQFLSEQSSGSLNQFFSILTQHFHLFGNARGARNTAEKLFSIQAVRISSIKAKTPEHYAKIEKDDLIKLLEQSGIDNSKIEVFKSGGEITPVKQSSSPTKSCPPQKRPQKKSRMCVSKRQKR